MADAYTRNRVHIVFSTKDRRDSITSDSKLREMIEGVAHDDKIAVHAVGGTANHVHVLLDVPAFLPLSKVVQSLKTNTARMLKETVPDFAWQEGFAAFSVSGSASDAVAEYIRTQPEHHARHSFEDEFKSLLVKHGIQFDERYVLG